MKCYHKMMLLSSKVSLELDSQKLIMEHFLIFSKAMYLHAVLRRPGVFIQFSYSQFVTC